ncbi:hypothetical protein Tco_1457005 [Tanacetum coccineum]
MAYLMRYGLLRMLRRRQSLSTSNFPKVNYSMLEWSTGIAGVTKATLGPETSGPQQVLEHEDNFDPEDKEGLSPAFVKENIDVLRTMIKELDNRGQEKVTPRKLFNEESGEAGSENSQMSPSAKKIGGYSSMGGGGWVPPGPRSREGLRAASEASKECLKE